MRDDNGDGKSVAGCADIGEQQWPDLFGIERDADGDRRVGRNLQVVYRQLRRNAGWNGNVHQRQPNINNAVLGPLGNRKLRQLHLRDDNGDGNSATDDRECGQRSDYM